MTAIPQIRLDHYNVRTRHLAESVRFYREVVGLREGPLPSGRPGAWMHDRSDLPVVHITAADAGDPAAQAALDAYLGAKDPASLRGSGAIDHVAFEATGFEAFRARLQALQVPHKEREVPQFALKQLFIEDPNGITVEMNFRAEPAAPAGQDAGSGEALERARALVPALRATVRDTTDASGALGALLDQLDSILRVRA